MYGDMMYCKTCGNVFKDCWRGHDTRTESLLLTNCPSCLSMHTMNANAFIEKYEKQGQLNQYSYTILYNHLKILSADFRLYIYNIDLPDVYLTKKERENTYRKI
jgi:hypothetical protein